MNLKLGKSSSLNTIVNPFKKECITTVDLYYSKVMFEKYFAWESTIRFRNGSTEGSHRIKVTDIESDNAFEEVVNKTRNFINNL